MEMEISQDGEMDRIIEIEEVLICDIGPACFTLWCFINIESNGDQSQVRKDLREVTGKTIDASTKDGW